MTKKIDKIKYDLIKEIMAIEEEALLTKISQDINIVRSKHKVWEQALAPMRKTITLEELKKEQNYKPITRNEFFAMAEELNIEEPLENLLAQLTK